MNRREFMRLGALLGVSMGSGLLAACAPAAPPPPTAAPAAPKPTTAPAPAATTAPAAVAPTTAPKPAAPTAASLPPARPRARSPSPRVSTPRAGPVRHHQRRVQGHALDDLRPAGLRDIDLGSSPAWPPAGRSLNDTTWELKLRQGVQFHNGEPFNADAVKFSFARYVDPTIKNGYATLLKPVTEVQVVDPSTVRVKTSEPFAELIEVLAQLRRDAAAQGRRRPPPSSSRSRSAPVRTSSCPGRRTTSSSSRRPARTGAASRSMKQVIFRPIPDAHRPHQRAAQRRRRHHHQRLAAPDQRRPEPARHRDLAGDRARLDHPDPQLPDHRRLQEEGSPPGAATTPSTRTS